MTPFLWWAVGVGVYLAVGVGVTWNIWRYEPHPEVQLEGWSSAVATVALWPIPCCILLGSVAVPLPSYTEWSERRREAQERREAPSEVTPAGRG